MSKGEEKIIQLLKKGGYRFEREKRFKDLKHGLYRFDFYVVGGRSTPCAIEYNGEAHYMQIRKFHHTRADGIPIYIIPYWELDNLTSADQIFTEKFRARDRWKNDRDKRKFDMRANF